MIHPKENIVTIYLDQNITTRIDSEPKLGKLKEIIKENLDETVIICYSQTHINDITSKSTELTSFVEKDLNNISNYTNDNFMFLDNGKINVIKRSPHELYISNISNTEINYSNIEDLLKSTKNEHIPGISDIIESLLGHFDSIPIADDMISGLKKLSINIPDNGSFKDLINGILSNQIPMMETDLYKKQRDLIQGNLGINPDGLANSSSPFSEIDESFKKLGIKDANKDVLNFKGSDITPPKFNEILNHYVYLDMHGFNQDKIIVGHPKKRDETFTNTSNDAQHTAYASYCNYYITKDKKNVKKARETYKQLKISTIVINPDTDSQELNDLIQIIERISNA